MAKNHFDDSLNRECHNGGGSWTEFFCKRIDLFQLIYSLVIIDVAYRPFLTIRRLTRTIDSAARSNEHSKLQWLRLRSACAMKRINLLMTNKLLFITRHILDRFCGCVFRIAHTFRCGALRFVSFSTDRWQRFAPQLTMNINQFVTYCMRHTN